MVVKCHYVPNRTTPRGFTANDAARVMCGTIANGASQEEIEAAAVERGCWTQADEQECRRKLSQAKQVALELVQGNNQILIASQALMTAWIIAIRGVIVLLTAVGARPAVVPLNLIRVQATNFRSRMTARQAANDEVFRLISNL